jgi:peptide/nickel transport system ATP-binding protein
MVGGKVTYLVEGEELDLNTLGPEERRRLRWEYVSYVPQGSMSVFNPVIKLQDTFRDFIESHVSGKTSGQAFEIAKGQLQELGLPVQILRAYPHQLSGGMKQRVTIALAALLRPRIMICDEPTTALDVVVQRGVVHLLKEIQRNLKNSIVIVTHDMGVQANIADRIGIMYAGKLVEEAKTETIFGSPLHPYTRYLINSLPRFGDKTTRESCPGNPPSLANLPGGCPFHDRCPHVMEICKQRMPDTTSVNSDHKVACWLVEGGIHANAA